MVNITPGAWQSCYNRATMGQRAFSLLEVLVAIVIAGLALSWFLYFLSEVHFQHFRAQAQLKKNDTLWCFLTDNFSSLSPEEAPEGFVFEEIPTEENGPKLLKIKARVGEAYLEVLKTLPQKGPSLPSFSQKKKAPFHPSDHSAPTPWPLR